jgi:hypothetical protein
MLQQRVSFFNAVTTLKHHSGPTVVDHALLVHLQEMNSVRATGQKRAVLDQLLSAWRSTCNSGGAAVIPLDE